MFEEIRRREKWSTKKRTYQNCTRISRKKIKTVTNDAERTWFKHKPIHIYQKIKFAYHVENISNLHSSKLIIEICMKFSAEWILYESLSYLSLLRIVRLGLQMHCAADMAKRQCFFFHFAFFLALVICART